MSTLVIGVEKLLALCLNLYRLLTRLHIWRPRHVEELSNLLLKLGFAKLFLKGNQLWWSMQLLKKVLNFLPMETLLMKFATLLPISSLSSSTMLVLYVIVLLIFWLRKLKTFSSSKREWKIHLMTLFPYCFLMFINFSFQLSPRLLVWFLKKKLNI